jgi:hypothetical protein
MASQSISAMSLARVVRFDIAQYPFAQVISEDVFGGHPLDVLHEALGTLGVTSGVEVPSLADSLELRRRMASLKDDSRFYRLYHQFVVGVVAALYRGSISYSSHPTFRVHLAGSPAVSKWHRDVDVTGRMDQINAWVPLVDVSGSNSLWIEQNYGGEDYRPVTLRYGEILLFDGGLLSHGSVANTTAITRVGMDFRFAPKRGIPPGFDVIALRRARTEGCTTTSC